MTPETSIYEFAKQGLALSTDKTAIWFYGRAISYRELFRRIDNVADHLYALGVRQGSVVTIHLPNCPQAVMAIYAVAKLGAICNMMHPQIPLDALKDKMEFVGSQFLITGNHFSDCGRVNFVNRLIFVDIAAHMGWPAKIKYRVGNRQKKPAEGISFERLERKAEFPAELPNQKDLSESCVFYLHSSGTAGTPKTVMHCHRAINREAIGISEGCSLGAVNEDVLLGIMPLYHGIGIADDMHSVISGGTKMVQMASWNAEYAAKMIRKHRVTIMTVVPKIYYDLCSRKDFCSDSFRFFFSGGEAIDPVFKKAFLSRTGKHIYEGYGLTELVAPCGVEVHDGVNFGYTPFPGYRFAIQNENGACSVSGEGELLVYSEATMMGYYQDEQATKEVFVEWMGTKWFRTGDYGVVDSRGNFHFKERLKNVIIQNGNNIFPGEVEAAILHSALVREACVVGVWNEERRTQNIYAYVVPVGDNRDDVAQSVLEQCLSRLPGYSVPKKVVVLDELPRNSTGKVDRRTLENLNSTL